MNPIWLTAQGSSLAALFDRNLSEQLEIAEHLTGAQNHAAQRIVGDGNGQAGFFADALVKIFQQRAAAGEHDAAITDVGGKFRRRTLEGDANRVHDGRNAFAEGLADFAVVNRDGFGHALDQVAALDFHGHGLVELVGGADFHFDLLGSALADQQVIFPLQIIHDSFVHLVAGHAHGTGVDDATQRDDGDVGGAAADVNHHIAAGLGDGQSRADGRDHGLFDEMHFAGFGAIGGVHDRALFHLSDFRRHADHDARVHQHLAVVRLLDEIVQHLLGDFEVGDHAVFHGLDGDDVAGRAAQHFFRLFADGLNLARILVDGEDGGVVDAVEVL